MAPIYRAGQGTEPGRAARPGRRSLLIGAATLPALLAPRKPRAADLPPPDSIAPLAQPEALPDLAVTGLAGGGHIKLSDFRGRPVVLNFWATWCVPCVVELPELDALAATGLAVLAISADRGGAATVTPFLARQPQPPAHLRVALDPRSTAVEAARVVGFPTTLIVDAAGRLRARLEGPAAWSQAAPRIQALTA